MLKRAYCSTEFSIREARSIVHDLFTPSPLIYWTDFLLSIAVGWGSFRAVAKTPLFSPLQITMYFVSCIAMYRAALFIHELVHLRRGTFRAFRVAWNLLCGIPFLMPSFLYHSHVAHHTRKHYGTRDDGEYLPLGHRPTREILIYLCQPFVIPALAILRFVVFTPIAWASPRFRHFVHQRASSMVMDPSYVRPLPTPPELRVWRLQEAACFLLAVGVGVMIVAGRVPWTLLIRGYLTAFGVIMINHLRTLGAHRFRHNGEELSFVEQLLDSINYPRWPLTSELWAPVGLRFHALHHLFPSLPYHNLGAAHRRLMEQLPADSPYLRTESPGLCQSLRELWQCAKQSEAAGAGSATSGAGTARAV